MEKIIDQLMLMYYAKYQDNKEKLEAEDFGSTSKERKELDEFIRAIVILYQNKSSRL
jgi:hypothetical protein